MRARLSVAIDKPEQNTYWKKLKTTTFGPSAASSIVDAN